MGPDNTSLKQKISQRLREEYFKIKTKQNKFFVITNVMKMLDNFNKNRLTKRGIIILCIYRVITVCLLPDLILFIIIVFLRSVYSFKERYQITMEYIAFFIEQKIYCFPFFLKWIIYICTHTTYRLIKWMLVMFLCLLFRSTLFYSISREKVKNWNIIIVQHDQCSIFEKKKAFIM